MQFSLDSHQKSRLKVYRLKVYRLKVYRLKVYRDHEARSPLNDICKVFHDCSLRRRLERR